jgi:hypothetical protein
MVMAPPNACIAEIGETAGLIWSMLEKSGPTSLAQLVKKSKKPRDLVMQALGWLAREEKIDIQEERRSRIISLR